MPYGYGSGKKRGKSKAPTTINKQAQKQLKELGYTPEKSKPKAKAKPKSRITIWPK